MNSFWTSDTHFGHANIIKYTNRPFSNVDEMNYTLVRNWNERVKTGDNVFHLGDFCFHNTKGGKEGEGQVHDANFWSSQLRGNKYYLAGNHDRHNKNNTHVKNIVISYKDISFFCTHRPQDADLRFKVNLVGHVHDAWLYKIVDDSILINVGVDVWDFRPVSFRDIQKLLAKVRR